MTDSASPEVKFFSNLYYILVSGVRSAFVIRARLSGDSRGKSRYFD